MARRDEKRKRGLGRRLVLLFLLNIVPIAALVAMIWAFRTGRMSWENLPEGLDRNGTWLGVAIALLFVVASLLLPLVHLVAKRLRASLGRSRIARSEGGFLRLVWELVLWPFRQILYRTFWLLRFAAYLASFALIIVAIFFMIRLIDPHFGERWVPVDDLLDRAEAYLER